MPKCLCERGCSSISERKREFTIRGTNIMILDAIPAPFFVISYGRWKLIDGKANLWRASNTSPTYCWAWKKVRWCVSKNMGNFRFCRMQYKAAVVLVICFSFLAITDWLINEARNVKFGHKLHHTLHMGYNKGCWKAMSSSLWHHNAL